MAYQLGLTQTSWTEGNFISGYPLELGTAHRKEPLSLKSFFGAKVETLYRTQQLPEGKLILPLASGYSSTCTLHHIWK